MLTPKDLDLFLLFIDCPHFLTTYHPIKNIFLLSPQAPLQGQGELSLHLKGLGEEASPRKYSEKKPLDWLYNQNEPVEGRANFQLNSVFKAYILANS